MRNIEGMIQGSNDLELAAAYQHTAQMTSSANRAGISGGGNPEWRFAADLVGEVFRTCYDELKYRWIHRGNKFDKDWSPGDLFNQWLVLYGKDAEEDSMGGPSDERDPERDEEERDLELAEIEV